MSVWAIIWMAVLIAVFVLTYVLNRNTPRPEGCEEMSECSGCANVACSHHSAHKMEE